MSRGEETESGDAPLRSTQKEFVGREREVAELCGGLEDARNGRGRFFLVTGEPGIGKTWLADEVARRADGAMAVVRAGCWEGAGAPAYWPFIQVLRAALRIADPDAQRRLMSAADPPVARDLFQLVPEIRRSVPSPEKASDDSEPNSEQARFRLFDAVATAIRNLAVHQPMMLILEDLHDADQPSLLMLRFVVRQLKDAPVLVLGTYRDIERASAEADRTGDPLTRTAIGGAGTELLIWLCDLAEAALRLERELTKPYVAEVAPIRGGLAYWLRVFAVLSGKLPPPGTVTATDSLVKGEIAFCQGNWEQADACLIEAADQTRQSSRFRRAWVYSSRAAKVRRILGQHSTAEAILRESLAISIEAPHIPFELHTRQELALLCAEMQRPEQARSHLERCREILAAGEDWRGLGGHIARAEAVVAAADRRFEAAYPHFASAVEIYRRYQMPFEEAETLHYWGRALIAAGVRGAALEKLDAASEIYWRHRAGERWLERVEADRSQAHSGGKFAEREPRAAQTAGSRDGVGVARNGDRSAAELAGTLRKQGEYWTLSRAGHESRLKHRKGFDYLVRLLRDPDREFAATDLIAGQDADGRGSATASVVSQAHQANATIARGLGDAGAALDATAKAQYKRRLEDLRDELELAGQHNDIGRAEQARAEIEFIQAEVAAAVGLGGRDRKSASHAERARLAVTKAIKAALGRIRDADPELGRHLSLSIQTGYSCAYRPQQPVTWQL